MCSGGVGVGVGVGVVGGKEEEGASSLVALFALSFWDEERCRELEVMKTGRKGTEEDGKSREEERGAERQRVRISFISVSFSLL